MALQFSFVSAKIAIFRNASQSDLRRQINGSRQDLTIGGLGTPNHVDRTSHKNCEEDAGAQSSTSPGAVPLQCSTVNAKCRIFKNASQSDLKRQINGSRQDLTIGGLDAPNHVDRTSHKNCEEDAGWQTSTSQGRRGPSVKHCEYKIHNFQKCIPKRFEASN